MSLTDELQFNEEGLIPAIVQERGTGRVLMQAYMNAEAVRRTVREGRAWYYSRSRDKLWLKGESSGHFQILSELRTDCDRDCLLLVVEQKGQGACHTGHYSCFYRRWDGDRFVEDEERTFTPDRVYNKDDETEEIANPGIGSILTELEELIRDRREKMPENSYTTSLFSAGEAEIRKKLGEEAVEVILAVERGDLTYEVGDLLYHLLVLLAERDLSLKEVADELAARRK